MVGYGGDEKVIGPVGVREAAARVGLIVAQARLGGGVWHMALQKKCTTSEKSSLKLRGASTNQKTRAHADAPSAESALALST